MEINETSIQPFTKANINKEKLLNVSHDFSYLKKKQIKINYSKLN